MENEEMLQQPTLPDMTIPDPRSPGEQQEMIAQALDYIENNYLDSLEKYQVLPLSKDLEAAPPSQLARLFHVTNIVYAKEEDFLQKAVTLLYTAYALSATVVVILRCNGSTSGGKCEYYLGLSCPNDRDNLSDIAASYQKAFLGNFVGSTATPLDNNTLQKLMEDIYDTSNGRGEKSITSVSGIPSLRHSDKHSITNFIQGIENLVTSLQGDSFTLVIQADPVAQGELRILRQAYEDCYTSLTPFSKTERNYNLSRSTGTQSTHSDSFSVGHQETDSQGNSLGKTKQHTQTAGSSTNISVNAGSIIAMAAQVAGGVISMAAPPLAPIGGIIATAGALTKEMGLFVSKGTNQSDSDSDGQTETESIQHSSGTSEQTTTSLSEGVSTQDGQGQSIQFSQENKRIQDLMKRLEKNLERLQECENFGTFSGCAYVISNSKSVNRRVAALYSALMRGDSSFTQSAQVHTWEPAASGYADLKQTLVHFFHPRFKYPLGDGYIPVTPAFLTSGQELALQIGLPKRSIPGVSVREVAEFGCNPPDGDTTISLGKIQRLTQVISTPVVLDTKSLTAHTFITGSTGAGKSNAIYTILDRLCAPKQEGEPVRFLVIEPAKGEYKDALGGNPGVKVYGTNPHKAELLRLNPFSFPRDTHVLEHIDRLVEIFNACWPMYAAMPSVLKAAVEQAYINCGWSLNTSTYLIAQKGGKPIYPTFRDVMNALSTVIDAKGFSSDTQGDYKGALLTRLESLTNGINGQVFCATQDIPDTELFDNNVIVDLSRVGSNETKALLMGILILKLQEYRMNQRETGEISSNSELRHITVLEEAHNLLRRTSTGQSQEGANLQGKSVEMLTNAIAEMRTYGEGFIIADQAPGLLDMATIRNTNTKIILRLPDEEDRQLVGRAAGLNDSQIIELAKLDTGVAAVFQNHWTEPVLCQIDRFQQSGKKYSYTPKEETVDPKREAFFKFLLDGTKFSPEYTDDLNFWVRHLDVGREAKELLLRLVEGKPVEKKYTGALLYSLLHGKSLIQQTLKTADPQLAQAFFDHRASELLCISQNLAQEIRLLVYTYAAQMVESDKVQCSELKAYGGVK